MAYSGIVPTLLVSVPSCFMSQVILDSLRIIIYFSGPKPLQILNCKHQCCNGAFECGRIYRVYEFRLGNNVRVTSQLVFTSRELVTKKAAPVSDLHLLSIIACTRSWR